MASWRYLARVFQLAITGPVGPTQDAVFGTLILVGTAIRLASVIAPPYLKINRDVPGWQIATFVAVAIFVVRLVVAMHRLRQEQPS